VGRGGEIHYSKTLDLLTARDVRGHEQGEMEFSVLGYSKDHRTDQRRVCRETGDVWDEIDKAGRDATLKLGNQIISLSQDEVEVGKAVMPILDEYKKNMKRRDCLGRSAEFLFRDKRQISEINQGLGKGRISLPLFWSLGGLREQKEFTMKGFLSKVRDSVRFLNIIAGISLTFLMLLTVMDVILRTLRRPIVGTYELVAFSGAGVIGCAVL